MAHDSSRGHLPPQPGSSPAKRKSTRERGSDAENAAAVHLEMQGYRILARNFTAKVGELDIVASHRGDLVFVEVRSRGANSTVDPAYSVDARKQRQVIRAAQVYVQRYVKGPAAMRFDVVLVTMTNPPTVEIIPDAFRPEIRF